MVRYWGVRVGPGGQYAEAARKGGFVAIEWHELGDLEWLASATDETAAARRLLEAYETAYGVQGMKASIGAGQVRRFVREIADRDIVFLPHTAQGIVYVGRVRGGFRHVSAPTDGCPYRQRRDVDWLRDVPRRDLPQPLLTSLGSIATVYSVDRRAEYARAIVEVAQTRSEPKGRDVIEHIRQRLHALHPKQFEEFVASFFKAIGYEAEPTQYVGDGGIDVKGWIEVEGLAEVALRVQVKRTRVNVGIEAVLKTRGALDVDEQGAIISLGGFTGQARTEAELPGKRTIALIDGEQFAEMLLEHWAELDAGVHAMLGVRPSAAVPLRERFVIADENG